MDVGDALRRANERIDELNDCFDLAGRTNARYEYFCECDDLGCLQRLALTRLEYRAVREHPARFIVAAGHVDPAANVVADLGSCFVVERLASGRVRRASGAAGLSGAGGGTRRTRTVHNA